MSSWHCSHAFVALFLCDGPSFFFGDYPVPPILESEVVRVNEEWDVDANDSLLPNPRASASGTLNLLVEEPKA